MRGEAGLLDLSVATLPTRHGERVMLQLAPGNSDFESLGMSDAIAQQLEGLLSKPGLLIVTGPAGSGRTTALYTAMARLDIRRLNVMTVENRIERLLDGVTQTQVSAQLSPGQALKAVLRHGPDILMLDAAGDPNEHPLHRLAVGEAVKVSASKRVLASLDAPTAAAAITVLLELGVEPAQLAQVLRGVLALRLVRRLDPVTRQAFEAGEAERRFLGLQSSDPTLQLYRAGREDMHPGSTGLHELLVPDDALRTMIQDAASTAALEQHARQCNSSLRDDARAKIISGTISLEEAARVLGGD